MREKDLSQAVSYALLVEAEIALSFAKMSEAWFDTYFANTTHSEAATRKRERLQAECARLETICESELNN